MELAGWLATGLLGAVVGVVGIDNFTLAAIVMASAATVAAITWATIKKW